MEKIVVLNSGGFDSVVLMNDIRCFLDPDSDIYSLHFLYGAPNQKMQKKCVKKVCKKVGAHYKEVRIPKFTWTKNDFYTKGENIYVEGRNLVFLSYALSYAESIGAKKVYLATLMSNGYVDTSASFLEYIDKIAALYGIRVIAPYSSLDKTYLLSLATHYDVKKDDFFSCDAPKFGKPCHKCFECTLLEEFYSNDIPVKAFIRNGRNIKDPEFRKLLFDTKIKEVRLLINNSCQLRCKHCFYGFENMVGDQLSVDEMKKVIDKCVFELGAINFHFSGKEPLFNEDIFEYAQYINENYPYCTYDVVTNGINLSKYVSKIKSLGFKKVYLSCDDFSEESVRTYKASKNLEILNMNGIDTEIFVDLHKGNVSKVKEGIRKLLKEYSCISSVYVRTIRSIGNAGDNIEPLSIDDLNTVYDNLWDLVEEFNNINFQYEISAEYAHILRQSRCELSDNLNTLEASFSSMLTSNFSLFAEIYCARYEGTITITPDGYVLGCASEVSCPTYNELSAGNIRDKSLNELIRIGKEKSLKLQEEKCSENSEYCLKLCPYTLNCINNSDNINLG